MIGVGLLAAGTGTLASSSHDRRSQRYLSGGTTMTPVTLADHEPDAERTLASPASPPCPHQRWLFRDINANGIDDDAGEIGIAGVTVTTQHVSAGVNRLQPWPLAITP